MLLCRHLNSMNYYDSRWVVQVDKRKDPSTLWCWVTITNFDYHSRQQSASPPTDHDRTNQDQVPTGLWKKKRIHGEKLIDYQQDQFFPRRGRWEEPISSLFHPIMALDMYSLFSFGNINKYLLISAQVYIFSTASTVMWRRSSMVKQINYRIGNIIRLTCNISAGGFIPANLR